jgi:hypothetical protein
MQGLNKIATMGLRRISSVKIPDLSKLPIKKGNHLPSDAVLKVPNIKETSFANDIKKINNTKLYNSIVKDIYHNLPDINTSQKRYLEGLMKNPIS